MCYMGTAKRTGPEASGEPEDVLQKLPLCRFRGDLLSEVCRETPPSTHTHPF